MRGTTSTVNIVTKNPGNAAIQVANARASPKVVYTTSQDGSLSPITIKCEKNLSVKIAAEGQAVVEVMDVWSPVGPSEARRASKVEGSFAKAASSQVKFADQATCVAHGAVGGRGRGGMRIDERHDGTDRINQLGPHGGTGCCRFGRGYEGWMPPQP